MQAAHSFQHIDEYIALYPKTVQEILQSIRKAIHKAAPEVEECISYQIPTFKLHGNLVHFAAYKSHIGFYPGAAAMVAFADKIKNYKHSKGTIQFPLEVPIPLDLIHNITLFRVVQQLEKKK
jgi:uncharacterized protein YdhG (YjbR/CyaY superfamily)